MRRIPSAQLSVATLIAALATPAFADLTPAEAWAALKDASEQSGQTVTVGGTVDTGTSLILTDVRFAIEQDEVNAVVQVDRMEFADDGGGRVRHTMSDMPLAVAGTGPEGETFEAVLSIAYSGYQSILSGDPGAIDAEYAADAIDLTLDGLNIDGQAATAAFQTRIGGVEGSYQVDAPAAGTDQPRVMSAFRAALAELSASLDDPDGKPVFRMSGTAANLVADSDGMGFANPGGADALGALNSVGTFSYGPADYSVELHSEMGPMQIDGKAAFSTLETALEGGRLRYSNSAQDASLSLVGGMVPLPVSLSLDAMVVGASMPLVPSDDSQDFSMELRLLGLEVGEEIWGMFDAAGMLPRDPAELILSLSGRGRLAADVFDPEFDASTMDGPPGEFESFAIDEFRLSLLGALLTATGAFTMDGIPSPIGMPQPVGALDLTATGLEALMQSLGQIGLMPPEQAGMAMMMIGMFAVPGDQPDTFVSRIELTADGQVLANGQRLR